MKLELGKRYVRRDSKITDWIVNSMPFIPMWPYQDPKTKATYTEDGKYYGGSDPRERDDDLISEYIEPQPVVEDTKPILHSVITVNSYV